MARAADLARVHPMNIGQIKFVSWSGAGILTLGLSFYVWDYVAHMAARNQMPDPKQVKRVLEDVEPVKVKAEEVVPYGDIKRLFHTTCSECKTNPNCRHLNWTGKEKEKPAPVSDTPQAPPKVKVDELVSVLMIKADMSDRKSSSIFFKYKNRASNVGLKNDGPAGGFLLKEGEHLGAPYDKIRLDESTGAGALFALRGRGARARAARAGDVRSHGTRARRPGFMTSFGGLVCAAAVMFPPDDDEPPRGGLRGNITPANWAPRLAYARVSKRA